MIAANTFPWEARFASQEKGVRCACGGASAARGKTQQANEGGRGRLLRDVACLAEGSVSMQPAGVRADSLLLSRHAADAKGQEQQVQLRQKLKELPALLRSGLTLRRKRSDAGGRIISRRISNPYLESPSNKVYGEGALCAGRALRNVFVLQASDLVKDRMSLMGLCRRSCIGSELVDWLLKRCPFIKSRSTAAGVWQLLLNMGIVLSVDRQIYFQDKYVFYQFSSDECTYLFCEYEGGNGWKNGVKFLLELMPVTSPRINRYNLDNRKIETAESNAEILARLTAAVQKELVAVLATKARKSVNQKALKPWQRSCTRTSKVVKKVWLIW